jgi:hypothetical protein
LRGYGNAIVLPQAAAFVGAVIDSFVEAVRVQDNDVVVVEAP